MFFFIIQGLPSNGINIFGSQLHTHGTGARAWTNHVRGGTELPLLNIDTHYSTHFQEIRRLPKTVNVLPVDTVILDNTEKTPNIKI